MSMKAKILELLREKKDRVAAGAPESEAYVSGQELCEQFGVSENCGMESHRTTEKMKAMSLKRYRTAATVCWIRRRKSTTRRISRAD